MKSAPPALFGYTANVGWLNTLSASTRNCTRRLLLSPILKLFCTDISKYCAHGPRTLSSVRGASPNCPNAGRMNADGFKYGWQLPPVGQLLLNKGFTSGTPATMSGRAL